MKSFIKSTKKEFLIMDIKDHYWRYDKEAEGFYSSYNLDDEIKKWFELFFEELSDFVEKNYGAFISYEEKNYNDEFHLIFDFTQEYLDENAINEPRLRNELTLVAKTILQEETIYPKLEKEKIFYIDQYKQKTNILYTNLCEVKNEKENYQTIMFQNLIEKLEKITPIQVVFTKNNAALVSYKGYAFDLEKMKQVVKNVMEEEQMSVSKIHFANPMIYEDSLHYPIIKKWATHFRKFYNQDNDIKKY